MGAEEYELLVSTLNKLPILKENLTSKREEYELARRMVYSQKAEIDEVKKELETKDEEIGKIDSKIKKNNQILEELDQVLADLEDNIKIEEEKFKPYSQRLDEANERLNCSYQGEDMEIGFNSRFIAEMLTNQESEDVTLEMSQPNRAGILVPATKDIDEEDVLMLVMPVMLNS